MTFFIVTTIIVLKDAFDVSQMLKILYLKNLDTI